MKDTLQGTIQNALKNLGINPETIVLEHPAELAHGDYSTSAALAYAKAAQTNPRVLAEKIVAELSKSSIPEIEKIEIAGPGFINFHLTKEFFWKTTQEVIAKGKDFGRNNFGNNKKVIVEYSSPNIAKPFTIGHLRSTIIGDSIARILGFSGYHVVRDNHLGDWGTQFGKLIVAIKKWGDLQALNTDPSPIKTLVGLYVQFHDEAEKDPKLEDEAREWFTKLEKNDEEATKIWKKCIEFSMSEFKRIYGRLGVSEFDTMHGESFFNDKMQAVIDDVKAKNIGKESEGAYLVFFDEEKKLPPLMLLKRDGSSLYALRDLATDRFRKTEYGGDILIINEVGAEQSLYFKQIFETEALLDYFGKNQRVHVAHGLYRFAEGKMSTRKGNVIWLEDILDEIEKKVTTKVLENNLKSADSKMIQQIAIAALKFNDLKRESISDIVFNYDEIVNIQGDSGPYLQYTVVRAQAILEKGKLEGISSDAKNPLRWEGTNLEKLLYRFPDVVEYAHEKLEPHHIAQYLIELASTFNSFYGAGKIVDAGDPASPYKLALTEAFSLTMKNGLYLLGIEVPEKM